MSAILITGGTGSFGQAAVRALLRGDYYERIIVFSRDELKQSEMRAAGLVDDRLRYFIGDVRDRDRLRRALWGVNDVLHAAAMKQVDTCEYNPLEAVKTNVYGTENVIEAALDRGVRRVLMIGTDKAVDPVNLYGSTKQTAERLVVDANVYAGGSCLFSASRYGNVIESRGSVLNTFLAQSVAGVPLSITDPTMTRFVLTLDQAVLFVFNMLRGMNGGEVFVPMLPAVTVETIAEAVMWPKVLKAQRIPRRPGEKMHEVLISRHEVERVSAHDGFFLIFSKKSSKPPLLPEGYASDVVKQLSTVQFRELAGLTDRVRVLH